MELYKWKVYYHLFPNGKYYIGITSEPTIEDRFKNGNGYSTQPVYKAIKKYGWDNIEHGLIAANITYNQANNFEKLLIKQLNTILPNGYNATYGGEGSTYYTDSDYEWICNKYLEGYNKNQIFQNSNYGEWIIDKVIDNLQIELTNELHNKRLLVQYNINAENILNDYKNGYTYQQISERQHCCLPILRNIIKQYASQQERIEYSQIKNKQRTTEIRAIAQFDLQNNLIATYRSCNAAATALNLDAKRILNICKHKKNYKTTHGFIFKFIDECTENELKGDKNGQL